MAKSLTLEEALAKIEGLEAENQKLKTDNTALNKENGQLRTDNGKLETSLKEVEETSLSAVTELKERLANLEAQKAGGAPVRKITKGEHAGSYEFTTASFNLNGQRIKAVDVKNDSDILILLVNKKSGIIRKLEKTNAE